MVTNLYPQGIICLFTDWAYYELIDDIPIIVHLAFPHKSKPDIRPYPPVKAYFWTQKYYEFGLRGNTSIRMYDIERCVCDAVKFRNKVGMDVTEQVLKSYMKRSDKKYQ